MPSDAVAVEISSIFDNVITNNLKYCCVCFRTEQERRLVDPENFLKCLSIMRIRTPEIITICYACELESSRAYALFQAVNFAAIINRWFKEVSAGPKRRDKDVMPKYLARFIAKNSRGQDRTPLCQWWSRVRARSDLVQTEVLVVSDTASVDGDCDSEEMTLQQETQPPDPASLPPLPSLDRDPTLDQIVVIDDEEDPLDISQSLPPLTPAPPLISAQPLLTNANIIANNSIGLTPKDTPAGILLQPILYGTDGTYYLINQVQTNAQNVVQTQEIDAQETEMAAQNLLPDENAQIVAQNNNFSEANSHCMSSSGEINILGVQTLSDGIELDEEEETKVPEGAFKRPLMSGRIDWEDKIPMDVISFVDATDPIVNKDTPKRRKKNKSEIIDLC